MANTEENKVANVGEKSKVLGFWDCMGFCVGQIIGSGIMVLTGIVIGLTGHGVVYCFILAAVLCIITYIPWMLLGSSIPENGAGYAYTRRLIGERLGFIYVAMFVITQVLISTYAIGFGSYFTAIFPIFNAKAVAIAVILVTLGINLVGLKTSSIVQMVMVVILMASLALFIVFGLPKVTWAELSLARANIAPNGARNFLMGIALLSFATGGARFIAENGSEIRNPGRNIPLSMIVSTVVVALFYTLIGCVASGVLPIEVVAFENLTHVAKEIFPPWLFIVFVCGGAWFALLTTLNGTYSWVTRGLQASAKQGWLPKIFIKEGKGGSPIILLCIFGLVGIIPIITNMSISGIANMGVGLDYLCEFIVLIACFRLPKKFAKEYSNAAFTIKSMPLFYTLLVIAGILMLGVAYVDLSDLTLTNYIVIAAYIVVVVVFMQFRYKHVKAQKELDGNIDS